MTRLKSPPKKSFSHVSRFRIFSFEKSPRFPLRPTPTLHHFPTLPLSSPREFHIPRNFQAHLSTTVSTAAPADRIRVNGGRFWIHWRCTKRHLKFLRSHEGEGAGGGAGELMACAPWIKCPGEKARHLGSLPRRLCRAAEGRATGGKDCGRQTSGERK